MIDELNYESTRVPFYPKSQKKDELVIKCAAAKSVPITRFWRSMGDGSDMSDIIVWMVSAFANPVYKTINAPIK